MQGIHGAKDLNYHHGIEHASENAKCTYISTRTAATSR
jgi:hypothetical protein